MTIFVIFCALILSAFFSGSEIAFVSASKLGVEIKKNQGERRGKILSNFYDKPQDFISTMLIGNNICLVIFTIFMTELMSPVITQYFGSGLGLLLVSTLIITVIVLIFGEFLPKTFYRLYANRVMYALAYPLLFFQKLLRFPAWIMTKMSNLFLSWFAGIPAEKSQKALTRIDLEHFIDDSVMTDSEEMDKDIFKNALQLNQIKVRDCMIPRTEIVHVTKDTSVEELIDVFRSSKLSRIVIVDGDIENVEGYIHHQQLLTNPKTIKKLILEMPFVPEAMNARDLMLNFVKEGTNIACVVNEFGSTAGLITLEDLLEEIFGEIEDEHDTEDLVEEQINEREYLFSGRQEISYLNEKYDLNLPEGDYHTLSGYLVMTGGEIPESGAEMELMGYKFELVLVSDTKIEIVRLIKPKEATEQEI